MPRSFIFPKSPSKVKAGDLKQQTLLLLWSGVKTLKSGLAVKPSRHWPENPDNPSRLSLPHPGGSWLSVPVVTKLYSLSSLLLLQAVPPSPVISTKTLFLNLQSRGSGCTRNLGRSYTYQTLSRDHLVIGMLALHHRRLARVRWPRRC